MCNRTSQFASSMRPGMTMLKFATTFTRWSRQVLSQSSPSTITRWKRPDERTSFENPSRLSRRVVRGLGLEEDASADAGGRPSAGHAELYGPRRARASGPSGNQPRYAYRGHAERHQI